MHEVEICYVNKKYPVFICKNCLKKNEIENLKNNIQKFRKEHSKSNKSNVKAWHSPFLTQNIVNYFNDINKKIVTECQNLIQDENNLIIKDMWINMYVEGDYTNIHSHYPIDFASCYYVDVEKNASPIIFPPDLEIVPENNMLIMFGGDLDHEVPPTKGKRTLISYNLKVLKGPKLNLPLNCRYLDARN